MGKTEERNENCQDGLSSFRDSNLVIFEYDAEILTTMPLYLLQGK